MADNLRLWVLEAREDLPADENPWRGIYDCNHAFIVRASSEQKARQFAQAQGADEVWPFHFGGRTGERTRVNAWLDDRYSICRELTAESGDAGVIMAYGIPG